MRILLAFVLITTWVATAWGDPKPYGYPIKDPFLATVVGTPPQFRADLPKQIPLQQAEIEIFPNREVPAVFWYDQKLQYAYALQKQEAPLVFLIAGTGSSYSGRSNQMLARAFYQAGFHVVSISSPTYENFIVAASRTSVPGDAVGDAEDLYRVMERISGELKGRAAVSDFYLVGYSLGAFNAAFVSWLDEQKQVFDFKKVLLINPPVRLYSSISLLDRMLENIPGGEDNFDHFFEKLVQGVTQVYKRSNQVNLSEDLLYKAFQALDLKNEEIAALIGVAFRLASANMAFTSDVMTNFGYIKPKNVFLTDNSSLGEYAKVSARLGFTDYFHAYFYPYHKAQDPSLGRAQLIDQMSLETIADYLRANDKIKVMHNANDPILEPGEIDFFPRVFGDRANIYPTGGHLGNMEYRDNVAYMIDLFKH